MKKILFVCQGLYGGGAEKVVVNLSNHLINKGYFVAIAATVIEKSYPINKDVQIRKLHGGHLGIIISLRKICCEINPDVVIAMGTFYNYSAILASPKQSVVIGSERTDPVVSGKGFFKRRFRNILYKRADHMVFQTPDALAYFPEKIRIKGVVIPNPLPEDLPQPYDGIREKKVVNFCRLTPAKNLPLLIESFCEFHITHPEYSLHIYGDGPLRDTLQDIINQKSCSDSIMLHPNQAGILEIIKDSAMFVSSSSWEGLSNSMLEAMAIGLPTICTDCPCGGAKMIIKDMDNGILVKNGDVGGLYKAMTKMADDEELAKNLSSNAIKIREELSIAKIAEKWEKLF